MGNFTLEIFKKDEQEKYNTWAIKNLETNNVYKELRFVKKEYLLAEKELNEVRTEVKEAKEQITAIAVRHEANVKNRKEAAQDAEKQGDHLMAQFIRNDIDVDKIILDREMAAANKVVAEVKEKFSTYEKVFKDAKANYEAKQDQFDVLDKERKKLHEEYVEAKEARKKIERSINNSRKAGK